MADETHQEAEVLRREIDTLLIKIDGKIDCMLDLMLDGNSRMTRMDEGLVGVNRRLDRIDEEIERIEKRLSA